jgi:hypothetical protein
MAGQARRGAHPGRSSRAASSPVLAGVSGAASGSATATRSRASSHTSTPELATRATYRNLIIRGLSPDEAAKLTGWMAGISVGESRWTLQEINQLLFLREMNRAGQFADPDEPAA